MWISNKRRIVIDPTPSGHTVTYKYLPDGTRIMRENNTEMEYYIFVDKHVHDNYFCDNVYKVLITGTLKKDLSF